MNEHTTQLNDESEVLFPESEPLNSVLREDVVDANELFLVEEAQDSTEQDNQERFILTSPVLALTNPFTFENVSSKSRDVNTATNTNLDDSSTINSSVNEFITVSSVERSHNDSSIHQPSISSQPIFNTGNFTGKNVVVESSQDVDRIYKRQGFRIGGLNLMVKYEDGSELSELPPIYPLPNSTDWFYGCCEMHGRLVPVFDLKKFFSFSYIKDQGNTTDIESLNPLHIASKNLMLFVLEHNENATGIIIDGLLERLTYTDDNLLENELAPDELSSCVLSSHLIDGEIWFDLDSLNFLDHLESQLK